MAFCLLLCPLQVLITADSKYLCTDRSARLTEAQASVPAASNGNLVYVTTCFFFVRVCPLQLLVTTESKYLCTDRTARLTEALPSVPAASNGNLVYVT